MAGSRLIRGARRCRSEKATTDHVFLHRLGVKIKFHSFGYQENDLI